jgi:hypothetical protein
MRKWLIKKLGGFTEQGYLTIDDCLNDIENSEDKHKILTLAVKKLYNTISKDDILTDKNGVWYFKDKAIDGSIKNLLIAEADAFRNSKLWSILQNDIKYQSNKRMYTDSLSVDDLIAGKLWLLTLDTFKTRLNSLQKGSGKFNITA